MNRDYATLGAVNPSTDVVTKQMDQRYTFKKAKQTIILIGDYILVF